MRGKGRITAWNDAKGFGFIEPFDGGARLFIHISAFSTREQRPAVQRVVTYSVSTDDKGRPRAVNATLAGTPKQRVRKNPGAKTAISVACLFYTILVLWLLFSNAPQFFLLIYGVIGMTAYFAYAIDKSAAQRGKWRIPESTLHLLSLFGGWPGALIARHHLRHKTRKQPFRSVFWLSVAGNIGGLIWLLSESGSQALHLAIESLT